MSHHVGRVRGGSHRTGTTVSAGCNNTQREQLARVLRGGTKRSGTAAAGGARFLPACMATTAAKTVDPPAFRFGLLGRVVPPS